MKILNLWAGYGYFPNLILFKITKENSLRLAVGHWQHYYPPLSILLQALPRFQQHHHNKEKLNVTTKKIKIQIITECNHQKNKNSNYNHGFDGNWYAVSTGNCFGLGIPDPNFVCGYFLLKLQFAY